MVQASPFLISCLVASSLLLMWLTFYNRRQHAASIQERLATYVSVPTTAAEMELRQPLRERVLKPMLRWLLAWMGRITPASNMEEIARRLIVAGHPGDLSPIDFVGLKVLSSLFVGALAAFYFFRRGDLPPVPAALFSVAVGLAGQLLPGMWLKNRIKRRQTAILRALPDALDMLTICVDAGLGFDAALLKVGEKWDNELSREFRRVVGEIRMGIRRAEAMRHMAERTDVPEVHAFVAVLVQADRLGVSIADILHVQSAQLRMRRRQRAEEQARKAGTKMIFPLVLFIFPALFAVILGPAVPRIMQAFGSI
jgi:tight adherence protein C